MKAFLVLPLLVVSGCGVSDCHGPPQAWEPGGDAAWSPPPDRLAGPVEALPDTAPKEGAVWTCPMHPEVRMPEPGKCPKCGMGLVEEKK